MLDWCHTVEQNRAVYLGKGGGARGKCGIFLWGVGSWGIGLVGAYRWGGIGWMGGSGWGLGFGEEWGFWEGEGVRRQGWENKHFSNPTCDGAQAPKPHMQLCLYINQSALQFLRVKLDDEKRSLSISFLYSCHHGSVALDGMVVFKLVHSDTYESWIGGFDSSDGCDGTDAAVRC
jgi:hypothetical protein